MTVRNTLLGVVAVLGLGCVVAVWPRDGRRLVSNEQTTLAPLSGSDGYVKPVVRYTHFPPASKRAAGKGRVIITGGAGFIGSQLGWHLHELGHEVLLIDNMRFGYDDNLVVNGVRFGQFIEADVLDPRVGPFFKGVDAVFHFAALSALPVCQSHPRDSMNVNVGGVAAVLEHCRVHSVRRFIFASTSATYENTKPDPPESPFTEDMPISPYLLYSLGKQQGELLVKSYAEIYGLDTTVLRFFNVYGPHQDFRRQSPPFTSYIIRELVNERVPVLHSDGTQRRDYVHVEDLMRLAMLVMTHEKAKGETFNVATGKHYSVNEMFAMVKERLNSTVSPRYNSAEKFWDAYPQLFEGARPIKKAALVAEVNKRTVGSCDKAKRLLGWNPRISMEEGLRTMVDFIVKTQRDQFAAASGGWKSQG